MLTDVQMAANPQYHTLRAKWLITDQTISTYEVLAKRPLVLMKAFNIVEADIISQGFVPLSGTRTIKQLVESAWDCYTHINRVTHYKLGRVYTFNSLKTGGISLTCLKSTKEACDTFNIQQYEMQMMLFTFFKNNPCHVLKTC